MAQLPAPAQATVLTQDVGSDKRFLAVHGRRSVIMGYPEAGLEVWGYPFQMLSGYHVGFITQGASAETDGLALLRRVDYRPDSVTRTYIGSNYLVREKIFVPLDQPGAIISYEVEGAAKVDVAIHFIPVMNLMWPGAVGGQYTRWDKDIPGYLITEPEHNFTAAIGSPETITHDDTVNSTVRQQSSLSFVVSPRATVSRSSAAKVYMVLNAATAPVPAAALHDLAAHSEELVTAAATHYAQLSSNGMKIQTPDADANQAIGWAQVALDQSWVCNSLLGCGIVAGYGPSRDARRPQYAWFFAGDGLITMNALVAAGDYARAKEELNFIIKYQDPKTGMVWHELSQSAGLIDWAKYPYMFVHVDITADYVAAVARYIEASGDRAFLADHWTTIEQAYQYCVALMNDADHLPHIPPDKEGGDEQARPGDDLSLSAGVLAAATGFEQMARLHGDLQMERDALARVASLQQAIATRYWDRATNFWIDGHTQAGAPITSRRQGSLRLLPKGVFSSEQTEALYRQLSSAEFRTDWGMRGTSSSALDYDPYSYGRGSVSAAASAVAATAFWMGHRPETGLSIWRDLVAWNRLDSPGHIHELLAGNFFQEQTESVPEQTWSSAGFLDTTVSGLLGLHVHGLENRVDLMPHLPAEWDRVTVENVRLPGSTLNFVVTQGPALIGLDVDNQGAAAQVVFEPMLPLGARVTGAECQGHRVEATVHAFAEDEHASLTVQVPTGTSQCKLQIKGGVALIEQRSPLNVGDPSTRMKITSLRLHGRTLSIEADVASKGGGSLVLRTPWKLLESSGAENRLLPNRDYEVHLLSSAGVSIGGYSHVVSAITFTDR